MEGQMSSDYSATEDRTMPMVVYGLYFGGYFTGGLTAIAGLIVALSQRATAGPIAQSHYTFLIRTFWIGLVWTIAWALVFAIAIPFSFILIGVPFLLLAKLMLAVGAVWYAVRLIVGIVHLSSDRAYPRPYAVLA
jgi:uncharacterized membrane protein